jgi:outer membrane protein assembly factor BamB
MTCQSLRTVLLHVFLVSAIAGCGDVCDSCRDSPEASTDSVARTVPVKTGQTPAAAPTETDFAACCDVETTAIAAPAPAAPSHDWPMFGGTPARNMVNLMDKNMPTEWSIAEGKEKNIKWMARLGNKAYGGPVIAHGRIFIGTNNAHPRDPSVKGEKAVVMCFAEADGKFLWQAAHDIPLENKEATAQGLCSTPVIDGDRLYYVTPSCELVCADVANGKTAWRLDMMKDLKVVPYHLGNCSPLVAGDLVFTMTSNGVHGETGKVASPQAPSFLAVNKKTGKIAWQSNLPGENIIEGQWSNPVYAEIKGRAQVIFPGGDNWLYSFEPKTGTLLWKFACTQAPAAKAGKTPNYMVATPVVHQDRIYVALGLYPEHPTPTKFSHILCVDISGAPALAWVYGGPMAAGRPPFGRSMSTVAIHGGLVYVAEESGFLHCLDAKTGKQYWDHDFLSSVWGSPYWVDGKIYIGSEEGEIFIFEHGKQKKLIRQISLEETYHGTPVAANGTLYLATATRLFAIGKK